MSLVYMTSINEGAIRNDNDLLDTYLERIADKDKDALAKLYNMTSPSVYGYALSILKNKEDAEDVLHDTYMNIFSSANSYKSMKKPLAWILTITRNLCMMKLRERKKTVDLADEDWNMPSDKFPMTTAEDRLVLKACMENLSDQERQIVMLHSVSGFKHREIADILSLPLSTVLSKYNRSIKKLKNILMQGESQ